MPIDRVICSLVTVDRSVVRYNLVKRGREEEGYCEDQRTEQHLVKTVRFLGIPVLRYSADKEEVPAHVMIELGALGSTSWRSKFAADIRNAAVGVHGH